MVLLGAFVLNQDYIIDKFCVNKSKPELKCNGKCHLKDAISKTSEENNEGRTSIISEIIFPVFYSEYQIDFQRVEYITKHYFIFNEKVESSYFSNIVHPPQNYILT